MKCDFLVLGADGMQGRIVTDFLLRRGHKVFGFDRNDANMRRHKGNPRFASRVADASNASKLLKLLREVKPEVVINCADGKSNLGVYKACLAARRNVVDLGSDIPMTKRQFAMHRDFVKAGIIGITGCGSTPGINNVLCEHAVNQLDTVDTIEAGFAWDSNIKAFVAPFSISAVIYEMQNEAHYVEDGRNKVILPQDSRQERTYRNIGRQAIFQIPHSETYTFYRRYKSKGAKTVRYFGSFPSHTLAMLKTLDELGFNNREKPLKFDGVEIKPTDLLGRLLKNKPMPKNYREYEVLWVNVDGMKDGAKKSINITCEAQSIEPWMYGGSNVDTAIPAALIAEMIAKGVITEKGSYEPAAVVPFDPFVEQLRKFKMIVRMNGKVLN